MLNDIIANVVSAAITALCKIMYEKLKSQKAPKKVADSQEENIKFYISLLLLYVSFIIQILNGIHFALRFIFGGIGGFCISEIAIIHYRFYQVANHKDKTLPKKSGKERNQKRSRHK